MLRRHLAQLLFGAGIACLAPCAALAASVPAPFAAAPASSLPVDRTGSLATAIDAAAAYVAAAVHDTGRFAYLRHLDGTPADDREYNLLRHAGTLFALSQYQAAHPHAADRLDAIRRAAAYLQRCCIAPLPDHPDALAVWSLPEITGRAGGAPQAKLGGAGLALVALTQVESVLPGTTDPATLQGLARFVLHMQKPDGSFYSKYRPDRGGRDDRWVSLYYPGEAALGLVMLYELDGNPRWLEAAIDALRHLARLRAGAGSADTPHDHWALIATARLFTQGAMVLRRVAPAGIGWDDVPTHPGTRTLLLRHAEQIVDAILAARIEAGEAGEAGCLAGGFHAEGRTAPTATRLEGLLAARTLPLQASRRDRLDAAVGAAIDFLLRAQVGDGPHRGAFTRVSIACTPEQPRAGEIRIDYVQHALSAMLEYRVQAHARAPRIDDSRRESPTNQSRKLQPGADQ